MNDLLHLIESIKQGDEGAFAQLLLQYKGVVDGAVRRFSGSFDMADGDWNGLCSPEDLEQYAALALYRAATTYSPDESGKGKDVSFGLYAKICINNALISALRKYRSEKRKRDAANNKVKSASTTRTSEGDPLFMLVSSESAGELVSRIKSSLSEYENKIFDCYVIGKSTNEIAHQLGKEEKSVSNALYRVKVKIRGLLKNQ